MSTSLPSKEIALADVPEVEEFEAKFIYNFFTPDERISEVSGIPSSILKKSGETSEVKYLIAISRFFPRYVKFSFKPIHIEDVSGVFSLEEARKISFKKIYGNIVKNNVSKIINEDEFSNYGFISVDFQDSNIDEKLHHFISGSKIEILNVIPEIKSKMGGAIKKPEFFKGKKNATQEFFDKIKNVNTQAKINVKYANSLIKSSFDDPSSLFTSELVPLYNLTKALQQNARSSTSHIGFDVQDYKTQINYIAVRKADIGDNKISATVVGYIIDKYEIKEDGYSKLEPIIIDNPGATSFVDFRVKYGAQYAYNIRTILKVDFQAIAEDTSDLVVATALISSKPSKKSTVKCVDTIPPPPPVDLNFRWAHNINNLMITWAFPTNSQRDIKRFQIFRRKNISEPYQLISEYNFDDSIEKTPFGEFPNPNIVEQMETAKTFFVDEEFRQTSKFIYTMACVDAHGFTSGYSQQFEVSYNKFKNKVIKTLISPSGAPKHYPNWFLLQDTFKDTIFASGHKRFKIIFNPEFYSVLNSAKEETQIIATKQNNDSYRMQIINLDQQKQQVVDILIDDRRDKTERIEKESILFGPSFGSKKF